MGVAEVDILHQQAQADFCGIHTFFWEIKPWYDKYNLDMGNSDQLSPDWKWLSLWTSILGTDSNVLKMIFYSLSNSILKMFF